MGIINRKWMASAFLGLGAAGIGCLLRSEYERNHLTTTEYTITSQKLTKEWDGYTLVLLADLHDKEFGSHNKILLDGIDAVHPDRIISSGDLICTADNRKGDLRISLDLLQALRKKYPVTCGNGNHEQRLRDCPQIFGKEHSWYAGQLRKMGIDYLQNETLTVRGTESNLLIRGLDIDDPYYWKKGKKLPLPDTYIADRLGPSSGNDFELLLAHSPLFLEEYAAWGADLVCSGHFHGGTIRLPLLGGIMTPQFQFFCRRDKGKHQLGNTTMIVSGGLGTHSVNIRLNNLPEIVVIRLKTAEDGEAVYETIGKTGSI